MYVAVTLWNGVECSRFLACRFLACSFPAGRLSFSLFATRMVWDFQPWGYWSTGMRCLQACRVRAALHVKSNSKRSRHFSSTLSNSHSVGITWSGHTYTCGAWSMIQIHIPSISTYEILWLAGINCHTYHHILSWRYHYYLLTDRSKLLGDWGGSLYGVKITIKSTDLFLLQSLATKYFMQN